MPSLLQSKLRPAQLPRFAVDRSRLLARLDDGAESRLILVAAPAGHGKSIVLAQWARTRPEPIAWLTVDARDADPARFAGHLVGALARADVVPDTDAPAHLAAAGGSLGDEFVDSIIAALDVHDAPVTIVLEDIDRFEPSPMLMDVERMIVESTPNVTFVLSCRADPGISLLRLRIRGELTELRADDLRFNHAEARALLDQLGGHALTTDQVDRLVTRTEGWPVAMHLAALSLRATADLEAFIAHFAGDDRNVADFLSSEVLQQESEEMQRFLLDISVLDDINPALCDAVLGRTDSEHVLHELEHRGLFLTPVDRHGSEYRYHRLVREFLRHDLQTDDAERARALRTAAADWYLDHDDPLRAADLLVDAEAWDELQKLIWSRTRQLWEAGLSKTVLSWIEALPAAMLRDNVRLRLAHATLCTIVGRSVLAREIIDELERDGALTAGEQLAADALAVSLVEMIEPPALVVERSERALAVLAAAPDVETPDIFGAATPASLECLVRLNAARAHLFLGEMDVARDAARRAVVLPGGRGANWTTHAHGTLALIDALAGDLSRAEGGATRALDIAGRYLATAHAATITPLLARAVVARARSELDTAFALANEAMERSRRWNRWPWVGFACSEIALLHLACGQPEAALRTVREFAQMPSPAPAPYVAARLRAIEARALTALGQADVAQQLLDVDAPAPTVDIASARLLVASASDDDSMLRKTLEAWPIAAFPFGALEFELWSAIVAMREGDRHTALDLATEAVARAELDGNVRLFLDAGPDGVRVIRDLARIRPSNFTRAVVDAAARRPNASIASELVEQLSERELAVLRHLPRRGTYGDIARDLFISQNTLKTHVRHICQKLGVSGRDAAVREAERLGLL